MRQPHEHPFDNTEKLLKTGIFVSLLIFVLELVGGFWSHSLALISDAWHIFIDIWGLIISFLAVYLARRPTNDRRTYGLHRMEVLAALANGFMVFVIVAGILYAAIKRFHQPPQVHGQLLTLVAAAGLILNLAVVGLFYRRSEHDLNLRGVFLHAMGDALSTVGVLIAGVVIILTEWRQIDPIVSALIAGLVLLGSGRLVRESVDMLLEAVPRGLDVTTVEAAMKQVDGVVSVHDLHIWSICSHLKALSGHVLLNPAHMSRQDTILEGMNQILKERFGILHTTIQVESKAWPTVERAQL